MPEWSAIVLAGGVGSRLRPLTLNIPKPIVPVANKPMIDYNLELLRNAGVSGKIAIIAKYKKERILEYFEKNQHFKDLNIVLPDIDPLDTADAVRKAADYIDTDHFIVSMADIVTNLPLHDFMSFHKEKGGIASITLKDVPHPRSFGVIMLNQESRILLFLEKPLPQELLLATLTFSKKETIRLQSNLVNTGIYAFNHGVLDILESIDDLMDFGKHVFPYLTREYGIFGYARRDYYWMDAGNPLTYLYTNWDVLRRWAFPYLPKCSYEDKGIWWTDPRGLIGSGIDFKPPLVIGRNVNIGSETKLGGNSAIGDDVNIGEKSIIKSSILWENVNIEEKTIMEETIICNDVTIPANSELAAGTVIGPNCHFKTAIKTNRGQIITKASEIE